MYKIIFALMCCAYNVCACDFCGGSPTVMNSDLLSLQPQSSLGINTIFRKFNYPTEENSLHQTILLNTNFTAAYAPNKRIELRANLPFIWVVNDMAQSKEKNVGLGDMSIMSNFKVLNISGLETKKLVGHTMVLGCGIELPTGKNKKLTDNRLQNFNIGSKSTDFLFSGVYSLNYQKWNIIGAGLVKINTKNKEHVRFGHLYSMQTGTAYIQNIKQSQFIPNVGVRMEIQQKNLHKNIIQDFTGSKVLFFQFGTDLNIQNWNLGMQIQQPIMQNTANNTIKQGTNFNIKCNFLIRKNKETTDQLCNLN